MPLEEEPARYKIVSALTLRLLEASVREMEQQGWRRAGGAAMARSTTSTQPPYWTQSLTLDSVPPMGADSPKNGAAPPASPGGKQRG